MNRARDLALVLAAALSVAHIAYFGDWAVEDAAISWAYAVNLANGLGAVPWPGAEPVEGYSNPTWVALVTLFQLVGVHPLWSSKFLAMAFTACTIPLVARLAERAVPEAPGPAGVTAAVLFALNTQVGIFGAAGLENPLFNFLLAAAMLRGLTEHEAPRQPPWSAALLVLLTLTRPEGFVYAIVLGGLSTLWRYRDGRSQVELSRWWLALLAPLLAWHFARWSYFGWALPATAYAKLPESQMHLLFWDGPGWVYVRMYAENSGQGVLLPLYVLAASGLRGRPALVGVAVIALGLPLYTWTAPGPGNDPLVWAQGVTRCVFPLIAAAALWFASLGTPHAQTRGTLWAVGTMVTFYAVSTRGDWMDGTRWMALAAVPGSVLLAAGVAEVAGLLESEAARRFRPLAPVTACLGFGLLQGIHSVAFSEEKEISPWMVRDRVWTGHEIAGRLHIDERPNVLTVDMGGFLMWSGWELLDIVGLTDMPIAQHRSKPWFDWFFIEYVVQEERPHLMRIGQILGRLKNLPQFKSQYFRGQYGWRVRRDLVFSDRWPGPPGRAVPFDGTTLVGWDVPEPRVAPGSELYLEYGVDNTDNRDLRWWVFLVDRDQRVAASWDIPRHWPETEDWPSDAVYHGRITLDLPEGVEPGTYRLGFALRTLDALNAPLPDAVLPEGAHVARMPQDAIFRWGEVVFPDGIEVVSAEDATTEAQADLDAARSRAAAGDCEGAHDAWKRARWHGLEPAWAASHEAEVTRGRASCWFARAQTDAEHRVDHLETTRKLDPDLPGLADALEAEADRLSALGAQERAAGNIDRAFRAYNDVLRLDPYRTRDRREAEEMRTKRYLAIDARRREQAAAAPPADPPADPPAEPPR